MTAWAGVLLGDGDFGKAHPAENAGHGNRSLASGLLDRDLVAPKFGEDFALERVGLGDDAEHARYAAIGSPAM